MQPNAHSTVCLQRCSGFIRIIKADGFELTAEYENDNIATGVGRLISGRSDCEAQIPPYFAAADFAWTEAGTIVVESGLVPPSARNSCTVSR